MLTTDTSISNYRMKESTKDTLLELNRVFYAEMAGAFDHKRQGTPPGLDRLLDYMPEYSRGDSQEASSNNETSRQPITVLDVGCGNGRFARILDKLNRPFTYVGIDRSAELLTFGEQNTIGLVNGTAAFQQVDLIASDWSSAVAANHGKFDVVLCTAVLHHLPSYALRLDVVRQIGSITTQTVILSAWQFLTSDRFVKKCLPWSEIGLADSDIEPGDALLPWKHERYMIRYVHQVDADEFHRLSVDAKLELTEQFHSDGKEGNLSLYVICKP